VLPAILEIESMNYRPFINLALALWTLWAAATALAQDNVRIGVLSNVDRQYMTEQRTMLQDLAASRLGRHFNGDRSNDLALLQALLDKRLVRPEQTRELQAMGVIMGDLLATDLDMHWVIYEDRLGRSRALRYQQSDNYLFPMTMISRRREADNHTPVADIYHKAREIIASRQPAMPFQ
jgi:hypothetical protein